MPKIPFTGQTYQARSKRANAQECINWYPESDPTGKHKVVLYPTPGLNKLNTLGIGPIRGFHVFNDLLYVASGNEIYEVDTSWGGVSRGTIDTNQGTVSMASYEVAANQRMCIADGTKGYMWDTSTFGAIGSNYPDSATHLEFFDGYIIANDPGNSNGKGKGVFNRSDSYDATTWAALNYGTAERDPDNLPALAVNHRNLLLIGKNTTELWYNSGRSTFAFDPLPGQFIEKGVVAPHSVAKFDRQTIWLSQDKRGVGQVIAAQGAQFQVISTKAIENSINGYSDITDAIGFVYQQLGHSFYVLIFPTGNETWVYDFTEKAWHRRKGYSLGRHRMQHHVYFNGKHVVGDYENGNIYWLDMDKYTDNGTTIERIRTTQHIHTDSDENVFYRNVRLDMEVGVGNSDEKDPQVLLRYSDDGGYTWSNWMYRDLGAIGDRDLQINFRNLVRSKDREFQIKVTDPVWAVLLGGYADITQAEERGLRE